MYSYELKRVRYLLQAYLRIRLKKIEKFVLHILENEQVLQKLSEKEQTYAQAGSRLPCQRNMWAVTSLLPRCRYQPRSLSCQYKLLRSFS